MTDQIPVVRSETKTRVITGVVGGSALVLLIVLGGFWGVALLSAVLAAVISLEMAKVLYTLSDQAEKTKALLGIGWLNIFASVLFPKAGLECFVFSFVGYFIYFLATVERHLASGLLRKHFDEFVYTLFILVYIVVFLSYLPLIRDGAFGSNWILLFLLICWSGDTGAYFVGRKYGKTKLYPAISPGKSVEGALGGLGASLVVSLLFKLIFFRHLSWAGVFITPLVVGATAQIGDLCESFFKRVFGLKDSGSILPGHGGMLDRFDGVIFSIPVMYMCIKLFG